MLYVIAVPMRAYVRCIRILLSPPTSSNRRLYSYGQETKSRRFLSARGRVHSKRGRRCRLRCRCCRCRRRWKFYHIRVGGMERINEKKGDASKRRRSLRTIYVFTTKSASNAQWRFPSLFRPETSLNVSLSRMTPSEFLFPSSYLRSLQSSAMYLLVPTCFLQTPHYYANPEYNA